MKKRYYIQDIITKEYLSINDNPINEFVIDIIDARIFDDEKDVFEFLSFYLNNKNPKSRNLTILNYYSLD